VADGGRIRIPGKGGEGPGGGPSGDLHAVIRVRPHRLFRREGRDIYLDLPLSVREAVLGAKVEVPSLEGRLTVTVPRGTDGGTRLRLAGKGVPDPAGGRRGDFYVVTRIRVPRKLDADASARLGEMSELDPPDLRKELFE
jgi:curved DNA-binding protein